MRLMILIIVLSSPIALARSFHYNENDILQLTILHNNDMHARFEQTDKHCGTCQPHEADANECFGGFARVSSVVKRYRNEAENGGPAVLYLNAGDTYTGTPWFSLFKDKVTSEFMNLLKPDAVSLGNHEFDLGVEGLLPFLNDVNFPLVIANLNNSDDHPLWQTRSLRKSVVFQIRDFKVGVIGYLTPETKNLVGKNDVQFLPEIDSINKESELLEKDGVNIIIAIGHSGYDVDKQIAKNCPLVDVVIGGHSHSFLYSGQHEHSEKVEGPYPTHVIQGSGKEVPVVQAYAFTKYMGELKLTFDRYGDLIGFNGRTLLLNYRVKQDPKILDLEDVYRPKVQEIMGEVFGVTRVLLDGSNCRFSECNVGNMIADAFIKTRLLQFNGMYMTDATVAFIASGDIRASIKIGKITRNDLETVLPFHNQLVAVNVTGNMILQILEHSIKRYSDTVGRGEFLQMSGVRAIYDMTRFPGSRVIAVSILCSQCKVPIYEKLQKNRKYGVLVTSFVYEGGDGYEFFKHSNGHYMNITVFDAVRGYIKNARTIYPALENRIKIKSH